ncbi:MAG TPA: hypothetical protein VMR37_07425 [Rhabdochlamydiaceae bacterium]|nr:hypothetical protein [Rhabdochlamydiaceae bacterium]
MVSIIKYLDSITLAIGDSTSNLSKGIDERHLYNTTESSFQCGTSFSYLTYYLTAIPYYLKTFDKTFSLHIPKIISEINTNPFPAILGAFGFAACVFRFGKDTLSLVRQYQFLSIFERRSWKGPGLGDALEEIKNLSTVSRERTLPNWLNEDITLKGGKDYLNSLLKKVYQNDPAAIKESTQLLDTMRSFASKKRILHVLGMAAAVLGAISCIGFFIVFPPALSIVFLVAISLLGTSIYMAKQGYVENRNGGFSFLNCVPLFLQNLPGNITGLARRWVMSNPVQTVQTMRQFPRLPRYLLEQEFRPRSNLELSKTLLDAHALSRRLVQEFRPDSNLELGKTLDVRNRQYQHLRHPRVRNTRAIS